VRLGNQLAKRVEEIRELRERVGRLESRNTLLKTEIGGLKERLRAAQQVVRARDWIRSMFERRTNGAVVINNDVYKRLAKKYHPDRNPASAEIMQDINELVQSLYPKAG
jgi:hypothetical protein